MMSLAGITELVEFFAEHREGFKEAIMDEWDQRPEGLSNAAWVEWFMGTIDRAIVRTRRTLH